MKITRKTNYKVKQLIRLPEKISLFFFIRPHNHIHFGNTLIYHEYLSALKGGKPCLANERGGVEVEVLLNINQFVELRGMI